MIVRALQLKCNNALYPDLYGHYREAKFTQTKHHWWWKVNRVFNQLEVTRNYTGLVLFLEEDHYVAEDFIYILKLMERTCKEACRHCNILSLGTYLKTYNYYGDSKKVGFISPLRTLILHVVHIVQVIFVACVPSFYLSAVFTHFHVYIFVMCSQLFEELKIFKFSSL